MKPRLSIIVTIYNVEPYLQKCIDSILVQTFRDFELILVDDGSPDSCPAICDAAAEKDGRVVVIHQKNGGVSAARNAGLNAARGEYIGFVDSDDYVAPQMYQTLYDAMQKNDAQLVICSYTYVDGEGRKLERLRSPMEKEEVLDRVQAVERLAGNGCWYYITPWNRLYRRELFDHIRFPLGKCHEDLYAAPHIFWACERIAIVPESLCFYVQRGGSIMHQMELGRYLDNIWAQFSLTDFAQEHGLDSLAFRSCNRLLQLLMDAEDGKVRIEDAALYKREKKRVRGRLWALMGTSGHGAAKARIWLYLLSPRVFTLLMKQKGRLKKKGNA